MATSGTFTFRLDVEEIIAEAFERCGKDIQVVPGYHLRSAVRSLNLLFSEWATRGINYWTATQTSQALVASTASYVLPVEVLDIISATIRRSGTDTTCARISMSEYNEIPVKTTEGRPTQFFFDRQYTPVLYLWQVPENATDTFEYWAIKQIEDASTALNDVDAPYRWTEAVCAGLAAKISLKLAADRFQLLSVESERVFQLASGDERERTNLSITTPGVAG